MTSLVVETMKGARSTAAHVLSRNAVGFLIWLPDFALEQQLKQRIDSAEPTEPMRAIIAQ